MACDGLAKAQAGRCRSHAARRPGRELGSFRQTEPTMEYISYSCGLGHGDHARAVARMSKATCGTSNNPDVASLIRDGRARLAPRRVRRRTGAAVTDESLGSLRRAESK